MQVVFYLKEQTYDVDEQRSDKTIYKLSILYICLVPFVVAIMIFNAYQGSINVVILMAGILNIVTMVLVWINGYVFQKSLTNAFAGSYIKNVSLGLFNLYFQVKLNVVFIISSFAGRCIFDFVRFIFHSWFKDMRRNSYEQKNWSFAIFYFLLILFIDIIPTILFIKNLNFVWTNETVLQRKLSMTGSDYPRLSKQHSSGQSENIKINRQSNGSGTRGFRTKFPKKRLVTPKTNLQDIPTDAGSNEVQS